MLDDRALALESAVDPQSTGTPFLMRLLSLKLAAWLRYRNRTNISGIPRVVSDAVSEDPLDLESLESPVFVVGLPRSGCTMLHQVMLSADPRRSRALSLRDLSSEMPKLVQEVGPKEAVGSYNLTQPCDDGWLAMGCSLLDVCTGFLSPSLASAYLEQSARPGAAREAYEMTKWLMTRALTRSRGQGHKRPILEPESESVRFVMRSISHLSHLEEMFEVFPKARVVWVHRSPCDVAFSVCQQVDHLAKAGVSMISPGSGATKSAFSLGDSVLQVLKSEVNRAMRAREALEARGKQFLDVDLSSFVRNPVEVVEALYKKLGLLGPEEKGFTAEARERIRDMISNPPVRPSAHDRELSAFGLSESRVGNAFAPYIARFSASSRRRVRAGCQSPEACSSCPGSPVLASRDRASSISLCRTPVSHTQAPSMPTTRPAPTVERAATSRCRGFSVSKRVPQRASQLQGFNFGF